MLKQKLRGSYGRLKNSREEVRAGVENQELTQKCFLTPIHIYMDTPDCLHKLNFGFGTIISEDLGMSWGFRRSSNATHQLLLLMLELGLLC